jgi:transcriptional regulator with XRE-family HTH domain
VTLAEQFGRRLFIARRRMGVTQEALAGMAGFHRTAVGLLEKGRRAPGLITIVTLADALGVDPGHLVQGMKPEAGSRPKKPSVVRRRLFVPFAGMQPKS